MSFHAAPTTHQGVTFTVVRVTEAAIQPSNRDATLATARRRFPGPPVVLMSQDSQGIPAYYGRPDLADFLSDIDHLRLPWRTYQN